MSAHEHSQVVVGFDFSHSSHEALNRAVKLACRAPWHVLQFVCVIDPHFPFPAVPTNDKVNLAYADRVQAEASAVIADALSSCQQSESPVHFFVHARIGKPADEILGVARDVGADLIIVGTRGLTGLERAMLGSVSERVAREAGCSVEIVRPKTYVYVPLLEVVETDNADHQYAAPHRYSYESQRVERRPKDWPLY